MRTHDEAVSASRGTGTTACCAPAAGTGYTLRIAGPDEFGRIRDLLAAAALPVAGVGGDTDAEYAVAVDSGGAVIGTAGLEWYDGFGLLRSVAVDPPWRGSGVGRALTLDRIAAARARGLGGVYALTTTAAAYFPRLGFTAVERAGVPAGIRGSAEFSALCPSTAAVLYLPLGGPAAERSVRVSVRDRYAAAARDVLDGAPASCGGGCGDAGTAARNPITSDLYDATAVAALPEAAVRASLGCGNPTALAELRPGETVLDLGSGGGIDVLLSARRVGPAGRAYGLDMTDEMLALARRNAAEAGVRNVEFLKGEIERIPLPDASVDVIISNCVINLSADKPTVLREAFRVLRPGGRFAVSDIVVRGAVPAALRRSMELWVGCVAGALEEGEFARLLEEVGFEQVEIEPTRIYRAEDAGTLLDGAGLDAAAAAELDGRFASAFVRAVRPPA